MTAVDYQWLIGTAVAVMFGVAGIAIAAFRAMGSRLDTAVEKMQTAIKAGDDVLHGRINRLREDVSDGYVRRVDLDSHMLRLDSSVKEIRDDQKSIIRSLAALEVTRGRAAEAAE